VPKPPPASIAGALTVPERLLLFCLASDTDWQAASITQATAQHMMVRGLIERDSGAGSFVPTDHGRAALEALLSRPLAVSVAGKSGREGGHGNIDASRGEPDVRLSREVTRVRIAESGRWALAERQVLRRLGRSRCPNRRCRRNRRRSRSCHTPGTTPRAADT
jgi:hypothetical protein